jgi:UV radiation resistance-associated gene protein
MASGSTRPLLLPANRKLRHLRGISLRSLSYAQPDRRATDDAAVSKSRTELQATDDGSSLRHAVSSEELRPKPRRRSTLVAIETPTMRQMKLEQAIESRVADVFFSLHLEGQDEPLYISELAQRATV